MFIIFITSSVYRTIHQPMAHQAVARSISINERDNIIGYPPIMIIWHIYMLYGIFTTYADPR